MFPSHLLQPDETPIIYQQQCTQLTSSFFFHLIRLQQSYKNNPCSLLVEQLIQVYSDCIYYFQQHSQSVSLYFQHKMKKLLLNKRKLDKEKVIQRQVIIDVIQTSILQKLTDEHSDSMGKYKNKVMSIIDQQREMLRQRKLKRNKNIGSMSLGTMSMDSLFESPDSKKLKGKSLTTSKVKMFAGLIDDEEVGEDKKSEDMNMEKETNEE